MLGFSIGLGLGQRRAGGGGGPAQLSSLDFIDSLPAELTYSGNTGTGTASTFRGSLTMPTTGARRTERGLLVEPAATNLATNPRQVGSVAITPGAAARTQVLAANSISTTSGSKVLTITDTGHGRVVGDRVSLQTVSAVGGITPAAAFNATFTDTQAYAIIAVVDANTYQIRHNVAATSTASGGGTPTARYFTGASDTIATGHARTLTGAVAARLLTVTNNAFQTTPVATGSLRRYEVAGTGTVDLSYDIITGFVTGDPVTFSQILAFEGWPNLDFTTTENITSWVLRLEELNASNVVVATQDYDLRNASPSPLCDDARLLSRTFTISHATATRVRFRHILVVSAAHFRLAIYDHSVTKTAWAPSIALPAPGATGSVSRTASDASMPLPFALSAQGTIHFDFDAPEIVSSRDCLLSIGSLRLTALGTSFPRDLELTDGTNTVVATGAITKTMYTEDTRKVVASWGPAGLVLSVDGSTAVTTGSYTSAGFGSTLWFGRKSDGSERAVVWVKQLELRDDVKSASAAAARSHILWAVPIAMPGRDFVVGRISTNPLKVPGVDALPAGVDLLGVRVRPQAANVLFEDWDFRGFHMLPGGTNTCPGLIIRNCLFDDVAAGSVFATISMSAQTVPWLMEQNTFVSAGDAANPLMSCVVQVLTGSASPTIRRNVLDGFVRDGINGFECSITENYFIARTTIFGAHADAIQIVGSVGPCLVEGNVIDCLNRFGNRAGANYGIYFVDDLAAHAGLVTVRNNVLLGGSYPDSFVRRTSPVRGFTQADVIDNFYQRGVFASSDNLKYTYPSLVSAQYPTTINYTGNRDLHRPAKLLTLA